MRQVNKIVKSMLSDRQLMMIRAQRRLWSAMKQEPPMTRVCNVCGFWLASSHGRPLPAMHEPGAAPAHETMARRKRQAH